MTAAGDPKKSRRRFLADLLFLGGGVSAAALLAKSQLGRAPTPSPSSTPAPQVAATPQEHPPEIAGEMIAPEAPISKGESVPPKMVPEGKVAIPTPDTPTAPPAYDGDYVAPVLESPPTPGKPIAPSQ